MVEVLGTVSQDPSRRACIVVLQSLPDHAVELLGITHPKALAIGRVRDDECGGFGSRALLHRAVQDGNLLCETCSTDVVTCYLDGLHRAVGAVDMVCEGAFSCVIGLDLLEELGIIVSPPLEGEAPLAEGAWSDPTSDQCSLHQQCPRATHRVDEVCLPTPSCHQQDTSGEDFAHRCLGLCHAPATLVQALARAV
jgi:hypothetical protein